MAFLCIFLSSPLIYKDFSVWMYCLCCECLFYCSIISSIGFTIYVPKQLILKETLRIKGLDVVFVLIFASQKVVGEKVRERNFD